MVWLQSLRMVNASNVIAAATTRNANLPIWRGLSRWQTRDTRVFAMKIDSVFGMIDNEALVPRCPSVARLVRAASSVRS